MSDVDALFPSFARVAKFFAVAKFESFLCEFCFFSRPVVLFPPRVHSNTVYFMPEFQFNSTRIFLSIMICFRCVTHFLNNYNALLCCEVFSEKF